ncbi:hypothetical protein [Reichenbachiella versicolor]|uniref:hypothetical protein n=1 Tax=Reichenbachiella versicolor TaxID=1821036 RepID=UPI000D6E6CB0|nr:hypothetical protein [Reichenbachiella versicolor]
MTKFTAKFLLPFVLFLLAACSDNQIKLGELRGEVINEKIKGMSEEEAKSLIGKEVILKDLRTLGIHEMIDAESGQCMLGYGSRREQDFGRYFFVGAFTNNSSNYDVNKFLGKESFLSEDFSYSNELVVPKEVCKSCEGDNIYKCLNKGQKATVSGKVFGIWADGSGEGTTIYLKLSGLHITSYVKE